MRLKRSKNLSQTGFPSLRTPKPGRLLGFTLLEVLVAFSILAISLGVLFQLFGQGFRAARVAEKYTHATLLSQSLLAGVGAETPLEPGVRSGKQGDIYGWEITVKPYGQESGEERQSSVQPFEVMVLVRWLDDDQERSIVLTSLRLGSRT